MKVPNSDPAASNRTSHVLHQVALALTVLVVAYGLIASAGNWGLSQLHLGLPAVLAISLAWLGYSVWQFHSSAKSKQPQDVSVMRLTIFHIFAALYVIGVVDFTSPLVYLWSLLIIASYLYLGIYGCLASVVALYLAMIVNVVFAAPTPDHALYMALSAMVATCIGIVAVAVIRSTQTDQLEIDESHAQVTLQQDRTLTLVNNLADAVISTDRYGTITLYNAAALSLLDTNANILGKNIDRTLNTKDSDGQKLSCWEMLHQASTVTTRDDVYIKDGDEQTRLEMTFSPVRGNYSATEDSDELGGYVIILRDITKSKSLEEERDEFISVVSHELRTPITIAEGTLSNVALMMEHSKTPNDRLKSAVGMAHEQVIFLARMVNDLSTLSRAERGVADEAEEIDVDAMLHDLYNEHREEAADKNLSFDLNLSGKAGQVMASRLYLKELLQNFITNAIKYTNEGGVTIKMRKSKGIITVSVTDTGIGISKADQRRIFGKFYRAEDYRTRETNGTGLGLYVAEKLARKLDTTINVTSRLNHGSTFSIDLPAYDKTTDKAKA